MQNVVQKQAQHSIRSLCPSSTYSIFTHSYTLVAQVDAFSSYVVVVYMIGNWQQFSLPLIIHSLSALITSFSGPITVTPQALGDRKYLAG